ncbi:MAG: TspO/MBR family protein [Geminicoccaceae bacterium]
MSLHARRRWQALLVASAVALVVAVLGMAATDLGPWYQNLRKPAWQPPDWLFGPAWTVIYALIVLSATSAWMAARDRAQRTRIVLLFALNALLNVGWSALFFQLRRPDWALWESALLWLSVLGLILAVRPISRTAMWLLVPYLAWITFATCLNLAVVRLNPIIPAG